MVEQLVRAVPERWREIAGVVVAPVIWIPPMQRAIAQFFLESSSPWVAAVKYVLFLFPAALWVVAVWCTQGSLYTLPFRGRRQAFVSTMLLMWWDAARAAWLYWAGVLRLALVLVGWSAMFVSLGMKLVARGAGRLAALPVTASRRVVKHYARPGAPWIAVLMFRFWCFVEATVFTWVLFPTVSTVVAKFVGPAHARAYTAPVLYVFLLLVVRASFASLRALADVVKTHEREWLAQIIAVGLSVSVFEVLVLYRALVQVLASWIAVRTAGRLELAAWLMMAIPLAGWITVRSMTWFLFAQFGTPALPTRLGRRPAGEPGGRPSSAPPTLGGGGWRAELDELGRGMGWLHEKSDELLAYLALPVLTVLAVAVNFGMVLVTSRPVFGVPFKGLKAVPDTGDILAAMAPPPRKGVSA
jgi:hypothetical protein